MSTPEIGLFDPDDWRAWWARFHDSELCDPELAMLSLRILEDDTIGDGVGSEVLNVDDGDGRVDVEVQYALKTYPERGRVFHVLSIHSEGDPLPPLVS